MENTVRTAYGSYLQDCMFLKKPFQMFENTTLNERFGIQAGIAPAINEYPGMGYFAIGTGGLASFVAANGAMMPEFNQHYSDNAGLYNQIPFVLRPLNDDIPASERARYGLRRIETHNGDTYVAYYLKRIDMTNADPVMETVTVANDVTTVTSFVPNSANLNPQPRLLNPTGVNTTDGQSVSVTSKIELVFTPEDIVELRNVANVLYGNEGFAIISEIALVTGLDKLVQGQAANNGVVNFNEVIAAQICTFTNTFVMASACKEGYIGKLDIGNTEPLFKLS